MVSITRGMLLGVTLSVGCVAPEGLEIGPPGGVVVSEDGRFTLEIAKGALERDTEIFIEEVECEHAESVGPCYVVEPVGLPLLTPGLVTYDLNSSARDYVDFERLTVLTEDSSGWKPLADRELDARGELLTASAVYLGAYALVTTVD